jgi:predicted alpha/beta superfamily hydrolase
MVAYATRRLIKDKLIPEVILIGIAYDTTYQWYTNYRQRDYTPSKTRIPHTGGGKTFLDFIKKELIPYINLEYRTTEDRTIVGHSLGGSLGFYSLLTNPSLF